MHRARGNRPGLLRLCRSSCSPVRERSPFHLRENPSGQRFSFVRHAIVIYKFRTGQTISQLQMVSGYTFIVERYSLLARQRELFYTEACERCPPTLPFWMRSVHPASCSTELLINVRL